MSAETESSSGRIAEELAAAQAAYLAAPIRRRAAVKAAKDAGWTVYRIAKTLGVYPRTVDTILDTLQREATEE